MNYKILLLTFALLIHIGLACNGYKAKLLSLNNCGGDNQVITVEDGFSVKLSKDCALVPKGCIVHKAFTKAISDYSFSKNGISAKEGKVDLCSAADNIDTEGKNFMKLFSLPEHCPVPEGKICADGNVKVDLSKYKTAISMLEGKVDVNYTIKHDTGVSCFHMQLEIEKK